MFFCFRLCENVKPFLACEPCTGVLQLTKVGPRYPVCIKIVNQVQVFINLKSMYFLDFSRKAGISLVPDRQQQCILIMTSLPSASSVIPFHFLSPDRLSCCSAFSTCWLLVDLHITHHFCLDVLGTSQS